MRTINNAALLACFLALASAAPSRAIELSLEENRAERGSVGFVDMHKLFSASPDAARAKEGFAEIVRQAQDRVNLKKTEVLKLRHGLEDAKIERDLIAKSTTSPTVVPQPPPADSADIDQTRVLALPGMTASTAPVPSPSTAAPQGLSIAQQLLEWDGRISGLQADLDLKEAELQREQQDADRGLLDVEGRQTDQVLARLYRAVSEVARREGVSVVIDKTTILYGHPAVDLTDKVLKYLKGSPRL